MAPCILGMCLLLRAIAATSAAPAVGGYCTPDLEVPSCAEGEVCLCCESAITISAGPRSCTRPFSFLSGIAAVLHSAFMGYSQSVTGGESRCFCVVNGTTCASLEGTALPMPPSGVPIAQMVDVDAFMGRWYQVYNSISSTLFTFGGSGPQDSCVSADYSLNADGKSIDVLNQGIRLDGRVTKIYGKATETEEPGKKKLTFSRFLRGEEVIDPPSFEGDYWIYHLGPSINGQYAYAIVGGPAAPENGLDKTQLFVLARDPITWKDTYDEEVLNWLANNGFDWWWNKPRPTGSIGSWQWFPPKFTVLSEEEREYGEFGQTGCAMIAELEAPLDGSPDPRTGNVTGVAASIATAIDLSAYVGRWYQMYNSISSTLFTFGGSGPQDACVSADYSLNSDGTSIDVINQGIRMDGTVTKIFGKATETVDAGKKKLSFSRFLRGEEVIEPPSFEGDYWIYNLGPIVDGKYAYAIVGGPAAPEYGLDKTQLFVLARDPVAWKSTYDQEVHTWLNKNGFTWWWNKPRATGSIGQWQWFPPRFTFLPEDERKYGEFGQTGCAAVTGLDAPLDGSLDPRN